MKVQINCVLLISNYPVLSAQSEENKFLYNPQKVRSK
jgi:hypothetical protein